MRREPDRTKLGVSMLLNPSEISDLIKNRIENPEEIKSFEWEGFHFYKEDTKSGIYTFIQE